MPSAVLLGALAALGQAPVSLPWATLLALGLVYPLFALTRRLRGAAWLGWAFGVGYFAATLFWIVEPFLVDLARHGWMAPFALVFTAGGFALFWAAGFALARWLAPTGAAGGRIRSVRAALAFALSMALMELARGYILTGFPWALLGHVWIGWAPMQLAAWIGPFGLTALTLFVPVLAVALWPRRGLLVPVLMVFAALYGAGAWRAAAPIPSAAEAPVLRLVQPNAAQHLKWDPEQAPIFFRRLLDFTAAGTEGRPDLIIWPETSVPALLNDAAPLLERIARAAGGVPVVAGIQREEAGRYYNSLVVLDAAGAVAELYDKHHLVPFGEYLPLADYIDAVGMTVFGASAGFGYAPGPGARLLDLGDLGAPLPLICYEAIFSQDVNAAPARPGWLLQITNDAWFGRVSGPYQHLAQARLRAVEQGLPMVRAANTGVSAVIDARGAVLHALPLNEAGWLDAPLPAALPPTLYARTGDWPSSVLILLGLCGMWITRRRGIDAAAAAG